MLITTLDTTADLVYRVRRGTPHNPLIIMLHGLSGDENVMWSFEPALPQQAIVISPRAPYTSRLGGYSWARSAAPHDLDHVEFGETLDVLRRFVPEMIRHYQAEARRVIVMGFSQGAALSYALSLSKPEMLCGVIALAGFMPENAVGLAMGSTALDIPRVQPSQGFPRYGYLILHGLEDEDVSIERARQARSLLKERGAPIAYHEYPIGHKIPMQGMKEIRRWLHNVLG